MNKKKIASLLLVGSLLIGGGVLGAKAWFTSNAKVASNLKVTMGTLELKATGDEVWTVENQGDTNLDSTTEVVKNQDGTYPTNNFTNVRPGDMFVKDVVLKNVGSLKSHVKIKTSQKNIPSELGGMIDWDLYINDKLTEYPLDPTIDMNADEEVKITLKIGLNGHYMNNDVQGPNKEDKIGKYHEILVNFLNSDVNLVDIEGTQVNAPK